MFLAMIKTNVFFNSCGERYCVSLFSFYPSDYTRSTAAGGERPTANYLLRLIDTLREQFSLARLSPGLSSQLIVRWV